MKYANGELCIDGVSLISIAKEFGTPLYVYSEKTLKDRIGIVKDTIGRIGDVYYAVKANANPYLLKIISSNGLGADTVSIGEIKMAIASGFPKNRIAFSGVGKRADELIFAINNNILINAESTEEIELISTIKKGIRIGIRVNPDVSVATHRYITTGRSENKFGIPIDSAVDAFLFAKERGLYPDTIHTHIGSQISEIEPYIETLNKLLELKEMLKSKGIEIEKIDLGGGFGIAYKDEEEFPIKAFAEKILEMKIKDVKLLFEPGRFIIGPASILLTKVLYRKFYNKNFIIVDAGMNDFIRPALYGAYHKVLNCRKRGSKNITADIVGPICESSDFIAKDKTIELPERGDYLAVLDTGAYGFSMSSNYNLRSRPAEVIIKNGKAKLIRERENL